MKAVIVTTLSMMLATSAWAVIDDLEDIGADNTVVSVRVGKGVESGKDFQIEISSSGSADIQSRTYGSSSIRAFGASNTPTDGAASGSRFVSTTTIGTGSSLFQNNDPIVFDFVHTSDSTAYPINAFGLKTLHLGRDPGTGGSDTLTLTAFDSSGGVVDSQTFTGGQGVASPTLEFLVRSFGVGDNSPIITRAELSGNMTGGFGIDDLLYLVPEPATLALFAAGTVGLLWRRRRTA
jgi:hypothetical protein